MQWLSGYSPFTRFGVPVLVDALAWTVAVVVAALLRYDFALERISWGPLWILISLIIIGQLALGFWLNLYRGRYRYGSFDEALMLLIVVGIIGVVGSLVLILLGTTWEVPRSVVAIATPIVFLVMSAPRYVKRLLVADYLKPAGDLAARTIVYGAGTLGTSLVTQMLADPKSLYIPVGFIDDNPAKLNLSVQGVRVLGRGVGLREVAQRSSATVVIVAIGRVDAALLRHIQDDLRDTAVTVKVLPPLEDLLRAGDQPPSIRDLSIEDLIGRAPVELDLQSIAHYVSGARVLVTGAGGSIGSELALQLSKFAPAALTLVDRDESGLQATQITIQGHGLLNTNDVVLADIRDPDALRRIFRRIRPQVVFHAAALKHLPLLEQFPDEAWKTNVLGTLNVLEAAQASGVGTFVNISTDKAANPTSVLGHSKRVAEKLTAWAAADTGLRYVSVRFGNVIGSRGSMLPTFQRLIEAGQSLTVTHREVTRYFMTIPEACQLVIQAGAVGRPGEVLILDMGEPVRILDIAERMIAMSGKDIGIVFTGLRPGEKLHEELVGIGETEERPFHQKISHAAVKSISPEALDYDGWVARLGPRQTNGNGPSADFWEQSAEITL